MSQLIEPDQLWGHFSLENKNQKNALLLWLLHHTLRLWAIRKHFNCQRKAPFSEVVASLTHLCCRQFLTQFLFRRRLPHSTTATFYLDLLQSVLWGTTWFRINPHPCSHWPRTPLSQNEFVMGAGWRGRLSWEAQHAWCERPWWPISWPSHP